MRKEGLRSRSTSPSLQRGRRRSKPITLFKKAMVHSSPSWSKVWKENRVWKLGMAAGTPEARKNSGPKKTKRRKLERCHTQIFHESELQIKDRKVPWQKSVKESQKREDELVQLKAELFSVTRADEGTKVELQDCFDSSVRSFDGADVTLEQKKASLKKN